MVKRATTETNSPTTNERSCSKDEIMGAKKVRVTNELIRRIDSEGIGNMSRKELRALLRKGYVERARVKTRNRSVRYAYKLTPNI